MRNSKKCNKSKPTYEKPDVGGIAKGIKQTTPPNVNVECECTICPSSERPCTNCGQVLECAGCGDHFECRPCDGESA